MEVRPEAVSGRGRVRCLTVNYHRWYSAIDPPYVIAEIELAEQAGLILLSNVVGSPPDDVKVGMAVTVDFANHEEIYLPVFRVLGDEVQP